MLVTYKITFGKIEEWEYKSVAGMAFFGPILTVILILIGIINLLLTIPYKLLFERKEKKDEIS